MNIIKEQLFCEYYKEWIETYKKGFVRNVTYSKYKVTAQWLEKLAPDLQVSELTKRNYQTLINKYAETHEKQTTADFSAHLKSSILDAIDEGFIKTDPTRKVAIKGKTPAEKKHKFLNKAELQALYDNLDLPKNVNWDWFILLLSKTGLRFSEALALTPNDFDFEERKIKISKAWDYRTHKGYAETKNISSKRTVTIDKDLNSQLIKLTKHLPKDKPIFVTNERVFNSTVNKRLKLLCIQSGIPIIALHGLRHTHASLLLYSGVSINSIAKRLGHANTTTTQKVYLHVIKELEDKDNDVIMQFLNAFEVKESEIDDDEYAEEAE